MPLTDDPVLQSIVANIDPKWRVDLVRFVQTGNASQQFLETLDRDTMLQEAVERAIFADEGDIREPYQEIVKSQESMPESAQQDYESVLRDARLAAAALEEAKERASRVMSNSKVSTALDTAVKASRSVIAALLSSCPGGHS